MKSGYIQFLFFMGVDMKWVDALQLSGVDERNVNDDVVRAKERLGYFKVPMLGTWHDLYEICGCVRLDPC